MKPNETTPTASQTPTPRPQSEPVSSSASHTPSQQEAATSIVRSQVDSVYESASQQEQANPYHRSHDPNPQPTPEQWKQYHSAWQSYYQKYYERYYVGHVHQARQALEAHAQAQISPQQSPNPVTLEPEGFDKNEALFELRSRLIDNVQVTATKAKKSRHFVPITAAICVMILFLFLQYNRVLIGNVKAYVSPGNINPQNIIVDPNLSTAVEQSSTQLVIPKINVDVPVDYNATPDNNSQMDAMTRGVAYFGIPGASSKPGQIGNTPIAGHSSNDIIDQGNYKFIFAQLDRLQKGDTIYANYQGTRYAYIVSRTEVVKPNEISKLVYDTTTPVITLITCTPIGTALNRLLVTAEQVSPSPGEAAAAPASSGTVPTSTKAEIPGNSPTFFERLFGAQ